MLADDIRGQSSKGVKYLGCCGDAHLIDISKVHTVAFPKSQH